SDSTGTLCAIQRGEVQCYGRESFGRFVGALYEDPKGNLWVGSENGIWRWKPGPQEHYALPGDLPVDAIVESQSGTLLLATVKGLKQLVGGKIQNYTLPMATGQFRPNIFFRSSDGGLWIGSHQGLSHLHQGMVDVFGPADGLSGDRVNNIFEDRE